MVVKTFRGLLANDGQDRIRLQTIRGKMGYKIINFSVMGSAPTTTDTEAVVKIFKKEQSTLSTTVDLTDSDLLAVSYWRQADNPAYPINTQVIIDPEIFNQDIYITHKEGSGSSSCNYYLELEVIPLDDAGAEYTTLKDMRQA
jgi:hypothetical protein